MDRIPYQKGDIFAVVGVGTIGLLFVQLLRLAGLVAVAIDFDNDRLDKAESMGAKHVINPKENNLIARIKEISSIGLDSTILTVTNKSTFADALSYIRLGGQINIFGMGIKNDPIPVDFNKIYKGELTIRSTYSATPDTLVRSFDLIMKKKKIDVKPLISKVLPLSDFKKGLDLMMDRKFYKALYKL